jgi:hypothetical protein
MSLVKIKTFLHEDSASVTFINDVEVWTLRHENISDIQAGCLKKIETGVYDFKIEQRDSIGFQENRSVTFEKHKNKSRKCWDMLMEMGFQEDSKPGQRLAEVYAEKKESIQEAKKMPMNEWMDIYMRNQKAIDSYDDEN